VPKITTTLASSDVGVAATNVGSSVTAVQAARLPMRPLKIGIGISLLMAGAYGILSDRRILSTDSAVVTAYVTEVRTPVDGVLTGMPASTGGRYEHGAVLGAVDNRLYNQQQLQNLSIIEQRAQSEAGAAASERALLENQRDDLLKRSQLNMRAVSSRLNGQKAEAERLLRARAAELNEARRELDRGTQLHDAGILANSEFEKLQSQVTVAAENEGAQRAAVNTLQGEIQAAEEGTFSEPGMNSDVSYSRQRADEVNIRLAQIEQSRIALDAQANEAHMNISSESARMMTMRHSDLISPVSGMLWKLEAVNGERVSMGDPVAQMVECDRSFVLAEIRQDSVPEVVVGAQARLRLTGETQELYGTVTDISGDLKQDDHSKLAAFPPQNPREHRATLRISLDDRRAASCAIGRSARVVIAIKDAGLPGRLWGHHL
jgi:multidrug resistance efflux pump